MKAESKHAQIPYKFNGESKSGNLAFNIIGTKLGGKYKIARIPFIVEDDPRLDWFNKKNKLEAEETAKFIVKACNNHDRLVEVLKDARLMLSQLSRSVMAHPDHLISGAQIIEDRIETLLTELKS